MGGIRQLVVIVGVALVGIPAFAQQSDRSVPPGAKVSLHTDREEYFLGEKIPLYFVVENVGKDAFTIELGGDYRGTNRATRFTVTAVDQDGTEAPDPTPDPICFGGFSFGELIPPGSNHILTLPLDRYRRLEKPGKYTLKVSHDLGWQGTKDRPLPVAKTIITIKMPTSGQARRIVQGMMLREDADFRLLGHPVYLDILQEYTAKGDRRALEGIGSIPTPEATLALLKLTGHADEDFARDVLIALNSRLPSSNKYEMQRREWLVTKSWREEFAPLARQEARRWLRRSDAASLEVGAKTLALIGTSADVPTLTRALDFAFEQGQKASGRLPTDVDPFDTFRTLFREADQMAERGVRPLNLEPRSPGELLFFAQAVGRQNDFRPDGWESRFFALLRSDQAKFRELALVYVPVADRFTFVPIIKTLLEDPSLAVRESACRAASRLNAWELSGAISETLKTTTDPDLFRTATFATNKLTPRLVRLEIFVDRLTEPEIRTRCLSELLSTLDHTGTILLGPGLGDFSAEEAVLSQTTWRRFIADHRQELAEGHRWRSDDPKVPIAELFPGYDFNN